MRILPSRIRHYLREKWRQLHYKDRLPAVIDVDSLTIEKNRHTLGLVEHWIDEKALENSMFKYGVTNEARQRLDLPVGKATTYTDVICTVHDKLGGTVRYLELGVSVGKNFLQVATYFKNSYLTAFEIEECNPVLEGFFDKRDRIPVEKGKSAFESKHYSLTKYAYGTNTIDYLSADIFDETAWKALEGKQFDVVFSDAFHSGEALLWEIKMLLRYRLICRDRFVLFWDDLGGEMTDAFIEIKKLLMRERYIARGDAAIVPLNGWLGENWCKHEIGIISNSFFG